MKLTLYTDDLLEAPADLLALGVFSDEPDRGLAFSQLNRALDGALERACREEEFRGRPGQTLLFNISTKIAARRVLVYGYGERERYDGESARRFAGAAARTARGVSATSVALVLTVHDAGADQGPVELVQALSEGVHLGSYAFTTYLTREAKEPSLREVRVCFAAEDVRGVRGSTLRDALARGQVLANAVTAARNLVNEPANTLTPSQMADLAKRMAKLAGLGLKVLGPKDLERQGMGLFLGVARGSEEEPRLIHLTYSPEVPEKDAPVICLVGKGLTFDAGGLSLKGREDMVHQKADMGGAAAVFGALQAVAVLRPKAVVHGILAATENMPDGRAIRPGDVLRSKRGLTVEVLDTDAEGRLVLADALTYAQELRPTDLVDVATLTQACVVALGRGIGGLFTPDDAMAADIATAARKSGERFWRLPLEADLRELLKSEVADLKNVGERQGAAIIAALFLREFVEAPTRWAHLDIAGPVLSGKDTGYVQKGATGFAVRTLVEYVGLRSGGFGPVGAQPAL
jgi:leucyl aminopeptidase